MRVLSPPKAHPYDRRKTITSSLAAGACLALILVISGCGVTDSNTYTLYRSSVLDGVNRIHISTFDAEDGEDYNEGNCRLAAELFQQQPDVKTRFWCEKGRYRK